MTSDFLEVIAARGRENDVYRALARYLEREWPFHYAEWTDIPAESGLVERLGAGGPHGLNGAVWRADKFCPYLDLPESIDAYFSSLSINTRKRYRYRRRLEELGMTLEYVTDPKDLPAAIDDFARLHTERRRQKKGEGIFATAAQRQFYRFAFERFLAEGWLELVFLRVGGERVATVCQFNYGDRIYYYQTGYSTAWEQYRVGFVLISLLIEEAIRQKKSSYEFLRGREEYKYRFGATGERRLTDLIVTNGNFTGAAVYRRRVWGRRLREFVGKILPPPVKAGISRMAESARTGGYR
ncbi:hypothetical protein GPICK_09080 [Geobacter pickeringii]|uniref:BioF2-like acetyltransferase domain-containing protein n=1 Tax=Geobacter pickeringii TaxID=345632 RepID=A0A0B5BA70_9BACT|nr:hypothetical protein GPICK_09080 [Geobacter pickeringii]